MKQEGEIEVEVVVLHRRKALDKGFQPFHFGQWIDMISQWLFSLGAREVGYGSEKPEDTDGIIVRAVFEQEPGDILIGDVVMRENIRARSPILLEDFDPHATRPILEAWAFAFKAKQETFQKIDSEISGFVYKLHTIMGYVPKLDPGYHSKIAARVMVAKPIEEPHPYTDDSDRRESCGA